MTADRITPAALSAMDQAAFTACLGDIYEHSPWVAERAWAARPYADRAALQQAMAGVLAAASRAEKLALIRAHPELAGKAAIRGELTADSRREQAGAGLDQCSAEEFAALTRLNQAYGVRFGFPFVIAVRGLGRQEIIAALERRLAHAPEQEFAEALVQIDRIAAFRLEAKIADP
ncbi:MAG: 2-oxo-4-hydroxy-4-carboxy-5-ureidoimidazoline decarboxylase [Rhodocyclaceae bacterium]|nr:2-oxo-4-hydroxy-4-carboxy-5-ureidoimidazoline decarboxylase [Rhodocyclaceae bacterium]